MNERSEVLTNRPWEAVHSTHWRVQYRSAAAMRGDAPHRHAVERFHAEANGE
jgi:hypothetical protein